MIKIEVDESYAFDFLSILQIKYEKTNKKELLQQIDSLIELIEQQIGDKLTKLILNSDEYDQVKKANSDTFDLVDKAKRDEVKASDVDYSNLIRFNKRKNLQNKFFSNSNNEIKLGYEQYDNRK